MQNSNAIILSEFQKTMVGVVEDSGFKDLDGMVDHIKELHKSKKE